MQATPFLWLLFLYCPSADPGALFLSWTGPMLALSVTADLREIVCTDNDPSAGSPTETLLRLLLPLNDQVWSTFRHPSRQ